MLTGMVHSIDPDVNPLNVNTNQQQEHNQVNDKAIGAKNGTVPNVNSQTQQTQDSDADPLAQWKKPEDNAQNQSQNQNQQQNQQATNTQNQQTNTQQNQQPTKATEIPVPTAEEFDTLAQKVSSTLAPINAELATKVLGGDAEALQQMLSGLSNDIISKTLRASTVTNNVMQKQNSQFTKDSIQADVTENQYKETAVRSAIAELPGLNKGMNPALLETAISELRKTHPGAPAQELGKEAARQLGLQLNIGPEDQNSTASEMDWGEEFGSPFAKLVP